MEAIQPEAKLTNAPLNGFDTSIAKNWINGEWMDSKKHLKSINPSTGELIGIYADGGLEEAEKAVESALDVFNGTSWKTDHALRARVLLAMAEQFELRSSAFIQALGSECGKIVSEATMEVQAAPAFLRYWSGKTFATGRAGEPKPGSISITLREAVGVAGIISPFNAPVALSIRSIAPALAAGTTVVLKLPGLTAQVNGIICEAFAATPGLPKGVINVITESGSEAAEYIVKSPAVRVISFTGSTKTGRNIMAAGAMQLKRINLELGGKTPMIIFDDADWQNAVYVLVKAITIFSGQFCMAGSRILVQAGIAEKVRKGLAEKLSAVKAGSPCHPSSEMGCMISKENVQRVNKMVEEAIACGAKPIVRGGPITEGPLSAGAYYLPTLLEINDPNLPIVQQEVFGPVATLQVFNTEDEAIALANNSEYGLAATIWTRDMDRPWRVAKAVQAGTIWINTYAQVFAQFEEGGYKQSGLGRLNGEAVLEHFLEYKHISFNPGVGIGSAD